MANRGPNQSEDNRRGADDGALQACEVTSTSVVKGFANRCPRPDAATTAQSCANPRVLVTSQPTPSCCLPRKWIDPSSKLRNVPLGNSRSFHSEFHVAIDIGGASMFIPKHVGIAGLHCAPLKTFSVLRAASALEDSCARADSRRASRRPRSRFAGRTLALETRTSSAPAACSRAAGPPARPRERALCRARDDALTPPPRTGGSHRCHPTCSRLIPATMRLPSSRTKIASNAPSLMLVAPELNS